MASSASMLVGWDDVYDRGVDVRYDRPSKHWKAMRIFGVRFLRLLLMMDACVGASNDIEGSEQ